MPHTPVSTLNDLYPTTCPHLLAVREKYADWNWYSENGYIRYSRGAVRSTYEHRLVAMRVYGRVPSGMHVHHVDGCITNNEASNLEVLTPAQHARIHHGPHGARIKCPVCGTVVPMPPSTAAKRTHCSAECRAKAQFAQDRPDRDRLWRLMRDVGSWRALGRMFGVSDSAVRKWARRYELDLSICDGRRKEASR